MPANFASWLALLKHRALHSYSVSLVRFTALFLQTRFQIRFNEPIDITVEHSTGVCTFYLCTQILL